MNHNLITHKGVRILCIAELRGQLSLLNELAVEHNASLILHTGSFGFFDDESLSRIHESYLRHIVAFSPLLDKQLIDQISELSRANGEYVDHDVTALRNLLEGVQISELMDFVRGYRLLNVPVYTIYGMVEDSNVLNKFKSGEYTVPNLYILDEDHTYTLDINNEVDLFLCGLGGSLSYQKLFHQGNSVTDDQLRNIIETKNFLPVPGEPGNVWLTMVQIGQFIKTVEENSKNNDVKIFLMHPSPSREGLLAHLGVFLKIDYTISNGLHFLYPSSFNELSVCPNFEFYKSKFSDSRNQLSSIWIKVQETIEAMISSDAKLQELLSVSLNAFDRIPVISSKSHNITNSEHEEIIPLSLSFNKRDINSNTIRLQSDAYYLSFQNQWHFNLCDISIGSVVLNIEDGRIKFEASSKGFDFSFKKDGRQIRERSNGFRRNQQPSSHDNNNNNKNSGNTVNYNKNGNNNNNSGSIGNSYRGRTRGRGGFKR